MRKLKYFEIREKNNEFYNCSWNAESQPEPEIEHLVGRQGQPRGAQVHAAFVPFLHLWLLHLDLSSLLQPGTLLLHFHCCVFHHITITNPGFCLFSYLFPPKAFLIFLQTKGLKSLEFSRKSGWKNVWNQTASEAQLSKDILNYSLSLWTFTMAIHLLLHCYCMYH